MKRLAGTAVNHPSCRQTPATVDFRFGILYCGPIRVMLTIQ